MTDRIRRRTLMLGGLGAAGWPIPASAADTDAEKSVAPVVDDLLVRLDDNASVHVLTPPELHIGAAPLLVWPMQPSLRLVRNNARFNQILLLRLPAPDLAGGLVAFSAICTHASCVVSEWNAGSSQLVCPCHASVYAARQDGAVVSGPAPRSLPTLKVKIVDGVLKVASGFNGRVGGDTSRTM